MANEETTMKKLFYPAIFYPNESGGYTVDIPDLDGCVTEGDDLENSIDMAQDAASGWILYELENGESFPTPSSLVEIDTPKGAFKSLITVDIDSYSERYGNKVVRKNITIPAWLNTYGEKNNINFSQVLTDALMKQAEKS